MKSALQNNLLAVILALGTANSASIPDWDYFCLKAMNSLIDTGFIYDVKCNTPPNSSLQKKDPLEGLSRDELFRQIFKTEPPPRLRNFTVQFFADDRFVSDLEIMYNHDFTSFSFASKKFSSYLDTLLTPEAREKVISADDFFNSRKLLDLNFDVDLDEMRYELRINVPPELKALQRTNLTNRSLPQGTPIEPAIFSSYLNMQGTEDFICRQYFHEKDYGKDKNQDNCERMQAILDLDGAVALLGFVFEGSGYIIEPVEREKFGKNHARRNDFRLIRDIYSMNSRISFGDVGANSGGLMRYETMGGVQYEYDKWLFNSDINDIFGEYYKMQFFLPMASQVEIRMNGRTMRRLNLPAGYHEISGFGGREGKNLMQIFLIRPDGSVEVIPYEFQLGNLRNLIKGETRYSITAGVRRSALIAGYEYEPDEPGSSIDFLYGLLPFLSLGVNGQASRNNLMTGGQILWSINGRNWLELRGLLNYEDSLGKRSELRYIYSTGYISYSLTGYYQNEHHNPNLFGKSTGLLANYAGLSASASTRFFSGSFSANAGMSLNRESVAARVTKRYGVALSQNILGISLNANASVNSDKNGWVPYASFGVGCSFGMDRHNITLANNTTMRSASMEPDEYEWNNRSNLNWNWTNGGSGTGARTYSAGIGMQNMMDNINFQLGAQHSYNRALASASYNLYDYDYDYYTRITHAIKTDMGVSFMFADGLWAFGRPVNRGFILAGTGKNLAGSTVHINYSDYYNDSFSENGWLGAAYYNQIYNYRPNEIRISLVDAPMGTWLEQNQYYSAGAYKQGYALRLGSDARALLHVNLLKEDSPLSYTYVIVNLLGSDGKPGSSKQATFTSSEGTLLMGNIRPGNKYRLSFGENSPLKDIDINIPENAGNFIELPDILVEHK